jgi:hypothetical protein
VIPRTISWRIGGTGGRRDTASFFEGPYHTVADESGKRHITGRPIILAERPVFEPDSVPPPPVPQVPRAPRADFWLTHLQQLGGRRPVNEMAALRELIGASSAGVAQVDWAGAHARLGFRLPADYREFIDTYLRARWSFAVAALSSWSLCPWTRWW